MNFNLIDTMILNTLPAGTSVDVFTDGAAIPNPGPAGASFVVTVSDVELAHRAIPLGVATNNIAEMTGALEALRFLSARPDLKLNIWTDSQYVQRGMSEWLTGWKARNWKGSDKKPVKNRAVWESLDKAASMFADLRWSWVRGHNGHAFNELADQLANAAAGREVAA